MGTADLERLAALLGSEALEVLAAVDNDSDFLGGGKRIQSDGLRNAEAALGGEGAALNARGLAADERQERRAALDTGQLFGEPTVQLQDSVISL